MDLGLLGRKALVTGQIRRPPGHNVRGKDMHVRVHPGWCGLPGLKAIRRAGRVLRRPGDRVCGLAVRCAHRRCQTAAVRRMVSTSSS